MRLWVPAGARPVVQQKVKPEQPVTQGASSRPSGVIEVIQAVLVDWGKQFWQNQREAWQLGSCILGHGVG